MRCLTILLLISSIARADSFCADSMSGDATSGLIVYFETLLDANELKSEDLLTLSKNPLHNPLPTRAKIETRIHREAIGEYLASGQINGAQIAIWAKQTLARRDDHDQTRAVKAKETHGIHEKMLFHRLEPAVIDGVELKHPIEVMPTLVTQSMWLETMRDNPSMFACGDDEVLVEVDGTEFYMQPNHPVESIDWFTAAEFANALSERDGLKPVYDLSEVERWKSNPETLLKEAPHAPIAAPGEDVYQTEGYRLPTADEAIFLQKHARSVERPFEAMSWVRANANRKTHPVAALESTIINGKEFFDILGNVSTFADPGHDMRWHSFDFQACVVMGPDFGMPEEQWFKEGFRWRRTSSAAGIGLRLVRTLK